MNILQSDARTLGYAEQRVFGNVELNADFVNEALVETAQHGAASGEVDTVAHDVGVELGRSLLEGAEHGRFDFRDCLLDAVAYFL